MITTSVAGRTWHFSHALGRNTAEHNGQTGGYGYPVDVAIAPDGFLFVLSKGWGKEVEGYHTDIYRRIGKTTVSENHVGDFARHEFTSPAGIAVSRDGNVYATDEHENEVLVFPPDRIQPFPQFDPSGETINRWGKTGSAPGYLNAPSGIKFDSSDNLIISDSGNDRIQKFTKNGETKGERILRHQSDPYFTTICRFLDTDTRNCTIYKARPKICREFPGKRSCGYYDFLTFERLTQEDPDWIATTD